MLRKKHAGSIKHCPTALTTKLKSSVVLGLSYGLVAGLYVGGVTAQVLSPPARSSQPSQSPQSPHHSLTQLKEMTVSATRNERYIDEVPASVTVITAETIEREGARDLKDIFRHELDVTVPSGPTRFSNAGTSAGRAGNEGVNIRGLGGNQVLMLIDGIRVPNGFSFGSFQTGRGDYIDVDGIKSVEVLRGPASTQYGSDGLAGAVSFRTLDPSDIYKKNAVGGGFARTGYASIDRSWSSTLGFAGKRGAWQGMLLGSFRLGHETINQGHDNSQNSDRTAPNPVDYNNRYLLAKAILSIDAQQQLGLTLESQRRTQATEVYSARALSPVRPFNTLSFSTRDRINRDRISLEHRYTDLDAPFIQKAETRLYWQDAQINQFATEDRSRAPTRTRDNSFQTRVFGLAAQFESHISSFLEQKLTYGLDWSQANITGVRDGTIPPYGGVFPDKAFPDTVYTMAGAFLQSEIEAGDFIITPGLRFDYYRIAPSDTGNSLMSRSGSHHGNRPGNHSGTFANQATTTDGYAVTPRLGIVWSLHPMFSPYAQYAQGFRAPTPDQVNNGFRNLASGYTSIGNPNLKPEYADSIEIGVRGYSQAISYSLSAFDNRYKNFISQQIVGGAGRPSNPTIYQYVNLTNAHIQGVVARLDWRFAKHWGLETGFAYLKGDSTLKGRKQPLNSIPPLKALLGLRYDEATWGARADWLWNAGKNSSKIAQANPEQYAPPAYGTLDLGLFWKPTQQFTLNANVNNVFDTKYWRWSDVSGLANNSAIKDAYTAPGRNIQLSIRYEF